MGCLNPPPTSPPLAAIEVLELNCQAASMAFRSHSLLYRFIEVSAVVWHVTVLVYPCYLPAVAVVLGNGRQCIMARFDHTKLPALPSL